MEISDGEEIPFEETTHYRVFILRPEGPIKWEGFDNKGNYGRAKQPDRAQEQLRVALIANDRLI